MILHVSFTARENGGSFKEEAIAHLKDHFSNASELTDRPLMGMYSMRHEFPTEWHRFLHPDADGGEQLLTVTLGQERFPFFTRNRDIVVMKMEVLAKCAQAGDYQAILSYTNRDGDPVTSTEITMPQNDSYGGLNMATIDVNGAGLNLEELDVSGPISLKLKQGGSPDYTGLDADLPEVEDVFLVLHYKVN